MSFVRNYSTFDLPTQWLVPGMQIQWNKDRGHTQWKWMDGGLTSLERTHEWIISMSHLPTLGHIQGRIRFQGSQENHASYASYASYRINIEGKFRR